MKKKKVIKKVFAVIMALSVIFSYSVVAMAEEGEHTHNSVTSRVECTAEDCDDGSVIVDGNSTPCIFCGGDGFVDVQS